jgi:chromosome partitioning protein
VTELLDTIERIKLELNQGLSVEGVVITMFDDRTNLAQSVAADLRAFFGDLMCETTIPRNIRLAEAPSHGKPALLYDPKSRGSEAYVQLAREVSAHAGRASSRVEAVPRSEVSG